MRNDEAGSREPRAGCREARRTLEAGSGEKMLHAEADEDCVVNLSHASRRQVA